MQGTKLLTVVQEGQSARFILKDEVKHGELYWPETLLSGTIRPWKGFSAEHARLYCHKRQAYVPVQIVQGGHPDEQDVWFVASLDSGEERLYTLRCEPGMPAPAGEWRMKESDEAAELDNGSFAVRILLGEGIGPEAPGPVLALGLGGRWIGTSRVDSRYHKLLAYRSERLAAGPLFADYRIVYTFEEQALYTVHVRFGCGMPYVRLDERMEGFAPEEEAHWRFIATELRLAHRYAQGHPPTTGDLSGLDELSEPIGIELDVAENYRLPLALAPYDSLAQRGFALQRRVPFASFREDGAAALGLGWFVKHAGDWDDGEYRLWQSSHTLSLKYELPDWGNGGFTCRYPLAAGRRTTGLLLYPRERELSLQQRYRELQQQMRATGKRPNAPVPIPWIHDVYLHHEVLALDKMKDWTLGWEEASSPQSRFHARKGEVESAEELYAHLFDQRVRPGRRFAESDELAKLALYGTMGPGIDPVSLRDVQRNWIEQYMRFAGELDPVRRRQLNAAYLLMAYVCADESFLPIRRMLAGHPNFLADVRSIPPAIAYLFPHHPDAACFLEQFERTIELNAAHHTRPDVSAWQALGGRWTENLACYTWAYLTPTLLVSWTLHHFLDGINRLALPDVVRFARWLLHSVTAPIPHPSRGGLERVYPPQGAHASREELPIILWMLGYELRGYAPLLAERLMGLFPPARLADVERELPIPIPMCEPPALYGTSCRLSSVKQTGYGLTMRAAYGKPEEVYVFLQQIDRGPNYRWGQAGAGGNGVIYYYAGGKRYSHNGAEDVGDGILLEDTERATNFGVLRHGVYHSIGPNTLHRPFYPFACAQYGIVESDPQPFAADRLDTNHEQLVRRPEPWSWPDYIARSVLLAGSDYFVVYDQVKDARVRGRFSWFVGEQDDFPCIHQLVPGVGYREATGGEPEQGRATKGRWYEGRGSFLTLVTPHPTILAEATLFGCRVRLDGRTDLVFQNGSEQEAGEGEVLFRGRTGLVKLGGLADGERRIELALFDGDRIGVAAAEVQVSRRGIGVTLQIVEREGRPIAWEGEFASDSDGGSIAIRCRTGRFEGVLYLNGRERVPVEPANGESSEWTLPVLRGHHTFELTPGDPLPAVPALERVVPVAPGQVEPVWTESPLASGYTIAWRRSREHTWQEVEAHGSRSVRCKVEGLVDGSKYEFRVAAVCGDRRSDWTDPYPVYLRRPDKPDGLRVRATTSGRHVEWGETLGTAEYRLYRSGCGELTSFACVYQGSENRFLDREFPTNEGFEYVVSAWNGFGESRLSGVVRSEPGALMPALPPRSGKFRRNFGTGAEPEAVPEYPE